MQPGLYIIATPIGNREDITVRALKILFEVDLLLCEDTRKTAQLLDHYQTMIQSWQISNRKTPSLLAYHEHIELEVLPTVIAKLKSDMAVGLVSNAGTPLISDPGFKLVQWCHQHALPVFSVPGPSSLTAALSIAGLAADKVTFLSFLPRKTKKQLDIWQALKTTSLNQTIVFFESPQRLQTTLETMSTVFGDIEVAVVKELTKIHETVQSRPIHQWLEVQTEIKGEIVVLFRLSQ